MLMTNLSQQSAGTETKDVTIFDFDLIIIALCFLLGLAGFGYILATLPGAAEILQGAEGVCITGGWKYALILTHVLAFALIPLTMQIFAASLRILGHLPRDFRFTIGLVVPYGGNCFRDWLVCNSVLVLSKPIYDA